MTENTDGWPPDTEVSARPQSIKAEPNRMSSNFDTKFQGNLVAAQWVRWSGVDLGSTVSVGRRFERPVGTTVKTRSAVLV